MHAIILTAIIAGAAMLVEDVLGTLLVQANAKDLAWLSGLLDALAWGAGIITTTVSVTALQGHSMLAKVVVITAITIANVLGSVMGVKIGQRILKAPVPVVPVRRSVPGKRTVKAVRDPGYPGEEPPSN